MKRIMTITVGLTMSVLMLFAFTACGGSAETPEDQAVAALDTQLAALKSADRMDGESNISISFFP